MSVSGKQSVLHVDAIMLSARPPVVSIWLWPAQQYLLGVALREFSECFCGGLYCRPVFTSGEGLLIVLACGGVGDPLLDPPLPYQLTDLT